MQSHTASFLRVAPLPNSVRKASSCAAQIDTLQRMTIALPLHRGDNLYEEAS